MRLILALGLLAVASTPAQAVDHLLLRWKKTGQCEIVTRLPLWGNHWIQLGAFDSRAEAERALTRERKTKACPERRSQRRAGEKPDPRADRATWGRERE